MQTLMNALPIVVTAIGKKYGVNVVVDPSAPTAATNGKTIILPAVPETKKAMAYIRGYIDHECAHVKYTDFDVKFYPGLRGSLLNVIEDIRIELLLGYDLPGAKVHLAELEELFVADGMYSELAIGDHPAKILINMIHHTLRVDLLQNVCTTALATKAKQIFEASFPEGMVDEIYELLKRVPGLKSTKDASDLVDDIIAAARQSLKEPPPDQGQKSSDGDESQDGSESTNGGDSDDSDSSSSSEDQDESSQSGGAETDSGDGKDPANGDESGDPGDSADATDGEGASNGEQTGGADDEPDSGKPQPGNPAKDQQDQDSGNNESGDSGSSSDDGQQGESDVSPGENDQGESTGSEEGDGDESSAGQTDNGSSGTESGADKDSDPGNSSSKGGREDNGDSGSEDESTEGSAKGGGASNAPSTDSDDSGSEGDACKVDGSESDSDAQKRNNVEILDESIDTEVVTHTDLGDKIAEALKGEASNYVHTSQTFLPSLPEEIEPIKSLVRINPTDVARATTDLRVRLTGLLQAEKLKRSHPKRRGTRLCTKSLHKLAVNDSRVFTKNVMKRDVNTGIVLLLDQSGSMNNMKLSATKAAMAIAQATHQLRGVQLCIAGYHMPAYDMKGRVSPMKKFGQRLDPDLFTPKADGGTPTTEALWWASAQLLTERSIERRIVITITDGRPHNPASTIDINNRMKKAGIEHYMVGINMEIDPLHCAKSCSITDIPQLAGKVTTMLKDILSS